MLTETTQQRLQRQLQEIQTGVEKLVAATPTEWFDRSSVGLVIIGVPEYSFKNPSGQVRSQARLKREYADWFERFSLLFPTPPSDLAKRIEEADQRVRNWIELGRNFEIGASREENARKVSADFEPLFEVLALHDGVGQPILVPDTNAVVAVADVRKFQGLVYGSACEIVLLPTVLAELDNLKIFARDQAFRAKVARTVRRIKGWRRQGSLHAGITLYRSITVRAEAREPRMAESLSWLDSTNRDDRILASALDLQAAEAASQVWLVTSDLNLQNKAERRIYHLPRLPSEDLGESP